MKILQSRIKTYYKEFTKNKLLKIKLVNLFFLFYLLSSFTESKLINIIEKYHYGKDLSENQACDIALQKAKKKAANSLGETITSDTILQCKESNKQESCRQFSNIWSASKGFLKNSTNKREIGYDETLNKYYCIQKLTAKVIATKKPDPNFDFDIKLNKNVFQIENKDINKENNIYTSKESLEISIFPLSKMYINIFYYSPSGTNNLYNEKINKLFPNSDCLDNYVERETVIPNSICNIAFQLEYTKNDFIIENHKQEFLLIIATKKQIKFKNQYTIKSLKEKISEVAALNIRKKDITINVFFNK